MADGFVLPSGTGRRIGGAGMTLKVGSKQSARWSAFEAEVGPGFDVGAHRHAEAEEIFYILQGELDLLAFEPRIRTSGDWTAWESADGAKVSRGGPGSLMFVPAGCLHAFTNPGTTPARMLFLVTPSGHEQYLEGVAELLSRPGPPDQPAIIALRARYDIEQLTPMIPDDVGSTDHLICSQLVDADYAANGERLFTDGRWPGYVKPGDLAGLLQRRRRLSA
jgi:quercetin dioxygenase-like cupin family protein